MSKRLLKDSMIYTGGNVIARGLNFIIQVTIWSNLFPPEAYGQLAYCYVFISFMAVILPFGMDAAFMNYYVRGKDKASYLKNTLFFISIIAMIFVLFALIFKQRLSPLFLRTNAAELFVLSLAILFFDILNNMGMLYLRAEGKAISSVVLQNIEIIVRLVLLLMLIFFVGENIKYILWANVGSSALLFSIFMILLLPRIRGAVISKDVIKELLIFALPFLISGIFDRTIELADRRLIGYYMGDEATGLYVASYTVAVLMRLLVYSFNAGWQPYFLSRIDKEGGREELESLYTRAGIIFISVWFLAAVWVPILIKIPIGHNRYVLHPSYWEGISIIPVIMGAYVAMGLYFLQLPSLYYYKRTGLNAVFIGIGAAVNVILNIILIPVLGIIGAAVSTLVSYGTMASIMRIWVLSKTKIVHQDFKLPGVVGLALILYINLGLLPIGLGAKALVSLIYVVIVIFLMPKKDSENKKRISERNKD